MKFLKLALPMTMLDRGGVMYRDRTYYGPAAQKLEF